MSGTQPNADLLAAWRAEHDPGASERERMWEQIAARAELAAPLAADVEMPRAATTPAVATLARTRVVVGAVALAAAAVLALVVAPPRSELARTIVPALQQSIRAVLPAVDVHVEAPAHPQPATVPSGPPTMEPAALAPVAIPAVPVEPRTKARRGPLRSEAPPSVDPAEVELLERARRRLAADPREALALFDEHAQSYPRSALAAERELGRADARCRSGDIDGARALVDRFIRTRPGSPLVARVRSICVEGQ